MKVCSDLILSFFFVVNILILTSCKNEQNSKPDLKTTYFPNTDIIQQTIEYKDGKKNGYMKQFYKNGQLKAKQHYVNDTLDDTSAMYFDNGKLKSIQIYKNKLKDGCWQAYNKNGQVYSEIYFKKDLMDGVCKAFTYRTGKLLTKISYKEGAKNGIEEQYYANGKMKSKTIYEMGRPCAGTEEYTESGKPIDNDFNIEVIEKDEVLMSNKLTYLFKPENLKKDDEAFKVLKVENGKRIESYGNLPLKNGYFTLEYTIMPGSFVMEQVTIAILRKTKFRNTFVKSKTINVAKNNY